VQYEPFGHDAIAEPSAAEVHEAGAAPPAGADAETAPPATVGTDAAAIAALEEELGAIEAELHSLDGAPAGASD
jgi:hypothetical protein